MKKILAILFVLSLLCGMCMSVGAYDPDLPRVVDEAGLLDASERISLESKITEIRERQQFDIVIWTTGTVYGADIMATADDLYDYQGYGYGDNYDDVLLLVAVDDRECWMSTCGYGINAFTDSDIDYILDEFAEEYQDGNYLAAFETFADYCDDYVTIARESEGFDPVFTAVLALIIGLVIALIATGIMRLQLKSVRFRYNASDYTKAGSMNVTESRDLYLYRTVSRREKPKENSGGSSTHRSSSGRSHGGGGRSL